MEQIILFGLLFLYRIYWSLGRKKPETDVLDSSDYKVKGRFDS